MLRGWLETQRGRRAFGRALHDGDAVEVLERYVDDHEAHLAAGALRNAGIAATVAHEEGLASAYFPQVWRLLVRRQDVERAAATLAAVRKQ